MPWLVRPQEERCQQEEVAGGKGAMLARLAALSFPVPPFVVVGVEAFQRMAGGSLEPGLAQELAEALEELGGPQTALAVRSSAIGEDAAQASFAGLYHTSLQVCGLEEVLEAIRACWASYHSPAAAAYRQQRGAAAQEGGMAVMVQQMVEPQWAGVCFTANPVTLALSEGLINAVPGLAEELVAGRVNPEEIVVRQADGAILRRRAGAHGIPLPEELVRAVWATATAIAEALGTPQDVEWAVQGERLFVLQSRPITTVVAVHCNRHLEPWKDDPTARPDDPQRLWSRAYADEIWAPPVSPLFYNVQNLTGSFVAWWRWHHDPTPLPPDVFKYYRAAAYVDLQVLKRKYQYHPRWARIAGILNMFPRHLQEEVRRAPFRWWGRLLRTLHFELRQRRLRSLRHNYRYLRQQWPAFVTTSDRWFDLDLDALSLPQLQQHLEEVRAVMARVAAPCVFAVAYHAHDLTFLLTSLLARWCGDSDTLYAQVTSGLEGSKTVEEAQALWELAQRLRELGPQVVERVLASDWQGSRPLLLGVPGGKEIVQELEAFWRAHRHRGATYKDLVFPRWGDDFDLLFEMVKGCLRSGSRSPQQEHRRAAEARRQAQAAVLQGLRGPLAPLRRALLRFLFHYNEVYMSERDNHRYYFDRVWYQLRRIYLSLGRRLSRGGLLAAPEDIFFLGTAEIAAALEGGLPAAEARRRVAVRRAEWQQTLLVQPPKFLQGYTPYSEGEGRPAQAAVLRGIAASPGTARGRARIALDVSQLPRVEEGDILVARQTDPGWTPVFARIAGLVLETGGVLAHGTSLCREYGRPCVTAVEQATRLIPDGSTIEVRGSEGAVHILERPEGGPGGQRW